MTNNQKKTILIIPKQLQKKKYRFIKTYPYNKETRDQCLKDLKNPKLTDEQRTEIKTLYNTPKVPLEREWQKVENSYRWNEPEFQEYLNLKDAKGNIITTGYGWATGYGNVAVVDSDHPAIKKLMLGQMPKTLTVRTGGGKGHFHFVFECKIKGKITLINDKKGDHYGEVQYQGQQVIGPGSTHPSGNKYTIVRDLPIAKITAKKLITTLKPYLTADDLRLYFHRKGEEIIEDEPPYEIVSIKPLLKRIKGLTQHGDEYVGSHPTHGSTTGHNFNINIKKNKWHCFRHHVGGGPIALVAVLEKIIKCEECGKGSEAFTEEKILKAKKIAKKKYGLKIEDKEPKKVAAAPPKKKRKRVTYISSLALPDDIYLEEILQDGKPVFVVYNKKADTWTIEKKVKVDKITYKPIPVTKNLLKSLIIPDGIEEYGTLTDLRKEMHNFALDEYDPVDSKPMYLLIIDLLLTSWISPDWQENMAEKFIPVINARGGSETGKKRFLTVTRWLTYHSRYILKTDRIPSIYRCLMPWNATLIMDEADLKDSKLDNELVQFINSRCDGVGLPRYNTKTQKIDDIYSFGLTIMATRTTFSDDGITSRCVVMPTTATDNPKDYDLIPSKEWLERGKVLQRKLILFKLRHIDGKMPIQLLIEGISSFRVRESLLILQGLKDEDPTLMKHIVELAKQMQEQAIIERSASPDGMVLNVVYNFLKDPATKLEKWKGSYIPICTIEKKPKKEKKKNDKKKEDENDEIIEDDEPIRIALTLKQISNTLNKEIWNEAISKIWRTSFHQGVISQKMIDKKRFLGTIQILHLEKLHKIFPKYVPDYNLPVCMEIEMGEQENLDLGDLDYGDFDE